MSKTKDKEWLEKFELAKKYFSEFGNLLIPYRYETKDGIKLGQWIGTQRRDYKNKKIFKERIKLLESIGMVWDSLEAQWQEFYNLAKQYNSEFGNLLIPARYEIKGVKLGVWLNNQRIAYKNEKLSQERINLLESIGMVWDPLEAQWQINYKLTEQYYNEFGNLLIPYDYETFDGIKLNLWLRRQRKDYRKNNLDINKIKLLEKLNIDWNPNDTKKDNWFFMYNLCFDYYNKYGNLYIQREYITSDGIKLGQWINEQRRKYKNTLKGEQRNKGRGVLSQEQIDLLNKIGMIWEPIPIKGCSFFEYVIYFYLKIIYGKTKVLYRDKSLGFEFDVYIPHLKIAFEYDGHPWHLKKLENDKKKNQFCIDNNITLYRFREEGLPKIDNFKNIINIVNVDNVKYEEKFNIIIKELNTIFKNNLNISKKDVYEEYHNYILKYFDLKWLEKYDLCLDYYEENGNLLIPINYEINGVKLGSWLGKQRQDYYKNKLSSEQIRLLNDLNMVWNVLEYQWEENYKLAEGYYEEFGNLLIPINYEINGVKLGTWISTQRIDYKNNKLSTEKIKLLEKINMVWDASFDYDKHWLDMYELANEYYLEFGNLLIPARYETKDGTKLGAWLSRQRLDYKNKRISQDRIDLLESIGMVWSVRRSADEELTK